MCWHRTSPSRSAAGSDQTHLPDLWMENKSVDGHLCRTSVPSAQSGRKGPGLVRLQAVTLHRRCIHQLVRLSDFFETHPSVFWGRKTCLFVSGEAPRWGAADAEIKVPSGENAELKHSSSKAWSRSVYSHTRYAYCQGFLSCFFSYHSGPFTCIFSKTSPDFSCVGCG